MTHLKTGQVSTELTVLPSQDVDLTFSRRSLGTLEGQVVLRLYRPSEECPTGGADLEPILL